MMAGTSSGSVTSGGQPNRVRPDWAGGSASAGGGSGAGQASAGQASTGDLDDIDRHIVRELARDARIANNALADRVGIAPSTCLARVRSLRERGVIRGYHADVDPAALGLGLQALISVRLQSDARGRLGEFLALVRRLPAVRDVYFVAGADDYLLQVATAGPGALRRLRA